MRLDRALVERGLASSRTRAQEMIASGDVTANGETVRKPSMKVDARAQLMLSGSAHDYVSRAALKLAFGLDHFGVDPKGVTALDLGSSTGGFTEVLLRRGAAKVYAVDVGTDQLHERLRQDTRVISLEKTHAKDVTARLIGAPLDLLVSDVSFISLRKALPMPLSLCAPKAELITLIKPQFELGPEAIGKGGRVLTPEPEQRAFIEDTIVPFIEAAGFTPSALADSPILGSSGTREFLLHAQKTPRA